MVDDGRVVAGTKVRLVEYICNQVSGRKIIICLQIEPLGAASPPSGASAAAPAPQQQYNPPAAAPPRGGYGAVVRQPPGGGGGSAGVRLTPIRGLNPYQNRWTIKARVTTKNAIRTWNKGPNNSGKLFSCVLTDSDGQEIQATFFREAVDKFEAMIQEGKVYHFSKGRVKVANRQFNPTSCEYEINFDSNSLVHEVEDDVGIVRMTLNPKPIASIESLDANAKLDVIGVVTEYGEVNQFQSKSGKELTKLEMTLADTSGASVRLTCWGEACHRTRSELENQGPNQVVCCKQASVSDWDGKTLSTGFGQVAIVNPDVPQTAQLRSWFDGGGYSGGAVRSLSSGGGGSRGGPAIEFKDRHTIASASECRVGLGSERGDVTMIKGTVAFFRKERITYAAEPGGKKKVVPQSDGTWYSESQNRSFDKCEYRYILGVLIADHSDGEWVTFFDDQGRALLGHSGDEMQNLKDSDEAAYDRAMDAHLWKRVLLKMKIREEMYNDQTRIKRSCISCTEIDYKKEGYDMLNAIRNWPAAA